MFMKFFNKISKQSKIKQTMFCVLLLLLSNVSLFVAGSFNKQTSTEMFASNITEYINNEWDDNYLTLQITSNDSDGERFISNLTYNEYFYWKYIFRNSDFGFVSTVNGSKKYEILYSEVDSLDSNLTFLFCGRNSNNAYHGYFKHEVYDLMLMFKGNNVISSGASNFMAISKSRADQILIERNFLPGDYEGFEEEDYLSLIGTNTTLLVDGWEYTLTIANIYFEEGNFFENVIDTFGEFVVSYITFPKLLEMEATYIFNGNLYQNMHRLNRISAFFKSDMYSFSFENNTISYFEENLNINHLFTKKNNDFFSYFITAFSCILFLAVLLIIYSFNDLHTIRNLVILTAAHFAPYFILNIINNIFGKISLFSYFSLKIYMLFSAMLLIYFALLIYWRKGGSKTE